MKNIEELRQSEHGAVRALLQDLAQVQSLEELVARRESMRTLQEKFAFLCCTQELNPIATDTRQASTLAENFSRNTASNRQPPTRPIVQAHSGNRNKIQMTAEQRDTLVKYLFDGDTTAFGTTLTKLEHLHSKEEANRYLSDLYYEKNWKQVETYAQAFWQIIETSFPI